MRYCCASIKSSLQTMVREMFVQNSPEICWAMELQGGLNGYFKLLVYQLRISKIYNTI